MLDATKLLSEPPLAPPGHRRGFWSSQPVRGSYLLTRHAPIKIKDQSYPGLFAIDSFGRDSALFALVIVIEALGLWLLVHGYWDRFGIAGFGDEGALMPVVAAAGAFVLDLLAALFHHWPYEKRRCVFENEMLLPRARRWTRDEDGIRRWVSNDLQWRLYLMRRGRVQPFRILSIACAAIIILLAIAKVFAIQMFLPSDIGGNVKLLVMVSYLLCAFLHIFVSGYFLSALTTKWAENKEKDRHLSHATHVHEAPFQREGTDFKPFECLLDNEPPFELKASDVSEDPAMKQLDGAYHCLSIIERPMKANLKEILAKYGLDASALDMAVRDIVLEAEQWLTLLDELDAFPAEGIDIRPETVTEALGQARNIKLRTLIDRRYVFSTYGLLRDEHLQSFMKEQTDEAKSAMMRWGHYAQLQQLWMA